MTINDENLDDAVICGKVLRSLLPKIHQLPKVLNPCFEKKALFNSGQFFVKKWRFSLKNRAIYFYEQKTQFIDKKIVGCTVSLKTSFKGREIRSPSKWQDG